jgi:hypothetical protein
MSCDFLSIFFCSISHRNLQAFTSIFSNITCLWIFIKWPINICDQQHMENYKIYNSIIIIITSILPNVNCEFLKISKMCHLTMLHLSNVPLLLLQKKFLILWHKIWTLLPMFFHVFVEANTIYKFPFKGLIRRPNM